MVIKYIYKHPWYSSTRQQFITEEYELYQTDGSFVAVYYEDPAPSLPHKIIFD